MPVLLTEAKNHQSANMDKIPLINAYILTGGKSHRFGSAKALAEIKGVSFLDKIFTTIAPHFSRVYSVGKKIYSPLLENIQDRYEKQAPLIGVITALQNSSTDWNFILSVDTPFIQSDVLNKLKKSLLQFPAADIILPQVKKQFIPLAALYHKNCLPVFEKAYLKGNFSLLSILNTLNISVILMDDFENELANINTVEALKNHLAIQKNTAMLEEI